MQCYLKIQQQARKQQAERELALSAEHDPPGGGGEDVCRSKSGFPTIHFVETASSVLRELPWILPKEYKVYIYVLYGLETFCIQYMYTYIRAVW